MNLNNQIDWSDTDRIVSNDVRFVMLDGDWWRESSSWQTRQNGSPELTLMGRTRTCLIGHGRARTPSAPQGILTDETHSFDPIGNETITCSYRDRATHTTTQTTQTPTSSLAAETIARCGLTVSSRSPTGVTTTYAYDALGRQVAVTDPLGNTVTTTYDAEGRVLAQRGATYPVDYTYDAYGNKVSMTTYRNEADVPVGGVVPNAPQTGDTTVGGVDPNAPQTGDTTVGGVIPNAPHAGDTTHWLYDEPSGCMTNKLYADGKGPSYSYTPDGKLARRTWARGIVTDYTYDNAGNLTRYCDALGRSTGYAINGERQTTIAYDSYGRISTMAVPTAAEESDQRHCSPSPSTFTSFQWSYLQGSDLKKSLTYPNGLTASWTYDANNQLLQVRNATPTNVISQFDYIYDAAGRRTAITKSGTAFGDLSGSIDSYTYNARSELTLARRTKNGQPIPGFSEDFDYDPIGNRRSSATYNEKGEAQASTYVANNLNQYTTRTTPGYAAVRGEADPNATVTVNENPTFSLGSYYFGSDLFDNTSDSGLANLETYAVKEGVGQGVGVEGEDIVSATTNQVYIAQLPETFAYDDDGDQTLIITKTGLWRVTYNGENRPILWVRDADNTTLTMSYDHMGRRREKNTQRFFYDGYLQVADNCGNVYTWDCSEPIATRPLAWCRDSVSSYYAHDGNKNVSEVLGTDDTIAAHYEYAPFGAVVAQRGSSAAASPWRFSSEYAEDEMSAAYYNYRHLEPTKGRWMSMDCVEDGANRYNFVGNIPNVSVDIRGQRKRSMTYISDQPGLNFAEFLSDALFISEDTESPHDFQPNKLLGKCDCIESLMIMIHGRATRNNERAVVQWGDTELVESSSKQEISDMFKGIRFCKECTLELRSCNIGNSLYLKDRLVEKTGCRIILYDRKVYLFELQVEEEE